MHNNNKAVLMSLVLVAVVLSGCSVFGSSTSSEVNDPLLVNRTDELSAGGLTVIGVGSAAALPDKAVVNLGIMVSDQDADAAVDRADRVMVEVKQALVVLGIAEADMQTSGFNVWLEERFNPSSLEPDFVAIRAENALAITVRDISMIGDVIKAGLNAGANQVRGITFGLQDTSGVEEQARASAIEQAGIHASSLAEKLGLVIGSPISAAEIRSSGPFPATEFARLQGGGGGGPDISPGEVAVTVEIEVTYEILSR
jgi:uncharacterized protein YggE